MRAHEFLNKTLDRPLINLRRLNRRKRREQRLRAWQTQRLPVVQVMYADHERLHQATELERANLELEQLRADIEATRAETSREQQKARTELAALEAKASDRNRSHIAKMARSEIARHWD